MTDHQLTVRFGFPVGLQWLLPLVCVTVIAGAAEAQPVSASVLASYHTSQGPSGLEHLQVLVLWRGQPGWYLRSSESGSGGGSASGGRRYMWVGRYGGLELSLVVDVERRTAEIQGRHTIDLREHNVIFIDNVDDGSGGRVVGRLLIDAGLRRAPGPPGEFLLPVLRAAPDFAEFLRCRDPQGPPLRGAFDFCAEILRP